ncbi:uncharacterized protein LOC111022140 [Momordica charantia]|uniref:Uncharacterized protein LOC111022140 n=1 Tax=Momordica charantia TaxID=3673 RepID=A0A6J1DN69_MOMCH|nr:uncharacterized protein LOC111022140 [Momordica charantia]
MDVVLGQVEDFIPAWVDVDVVYSLLLIRDHWVLVAIDMTQSEIFVYDSLPGHISTSKLMIDLRPLSHTIPSLLYACGLMDTADCKLRKTPWHVYRPTTDTRQKGGSELHVGKIFVSKQDLCMVMSNAAMRSNREYKVSRSTKSKFVVRCINNTCNLRVATHSVGKSSIFCISKYVDAHTCMIDTVNHDHKQASSSIVANLIKDRVAGIGRIYMIKHIKEDVRKEFGVNKSYDKAHRARELAYAIVRGRPEDSYMHLHVYGEAIKIEYPGAIFHIETKGSLNFKYPFMALGASIRGFQSITRCVIMVDGTHLKGKFRGVLLIGVAMDENNQIYPFAFAIVDNESDASWKWFMKNLKDMIGDPQKLVFIYDRHDAAYAYRKSQFTYYWNQILSVGSGSLAKYLQEIGVERWARCYQVGRRYENMTTNSTKSERRTHWSTQNTSHSDYADERLALQFEKSRRYTVKPVDWCMFHVEDAGLDGTVDLNAHTCTCMEFQYMGIPCSHAIAAAGTRI